MKLSSIYKIGIVFIAVLIPLLYNNNENNLIDGYSVILAELILWTIFLELKFVALNNPILKIINLTTIFLISGRVATLMIFPRSNILMNSADVEAGNLADALLFVYVFYLVVYASIYLSSNDNFNYKNFRDNVWRYFDYCNINFFLVILIILIVKGFLSSADRYTPDAEEGQSLFLYLFNSLNFLTILIPFWLLGWEKISGKTKFYSIAVLLIYIVSGLLVGKRSAIAGLVFIAIATYLFGFKDLPISKKVLMYFGLGTIISIVVVFPVATAIRYASISQIDSSLDIITSIDSFYLILDIAIAQFDTIMSIVSLRMGFLDYIVIIVNNTSDPGFNSNINLSGNFANIIDRLIPGSIFDESLPSTRLFAVEYLGRTFEFARNNYLTQIFTFYGINYIVFGGWLSLLVIFPLVYLINILLSSLYSARSFFIYPFFMSVIIALWDMFFQNFGYDTIILLMIYFNIGMYFLTLFFILIKNVKKYFSDQMRLINSPPSKSFINND